MSFAGTATDTDGTVVAWRWSFGGGAPATTVEQPGPVRFDRAGTFAVTFNVTDNRGASDPSPDTRTVTVLATNTPPDARIDAPAGDVTVQAGLAVDFAGSASDPDGQVVAFFWDFGGGAVNRNVEDPGPTRFDVPGTWTVRFNVTDNAGASDPAPAELRVRVLGDVGGGVVEERLDVDVTSPGSAGRVDGHDVIFVLRAVATQDLRADVNDDGRVDVLDVQAVQSALGSVSEP